MKVHINDDIKELLLLEYSKYLPNETGGILFGHYSKDLEVAIVTHVFLNSDDSKSYRRNFQRGIRGFNTFSKRMWAKGEFYLGEWHTHPFSLPEMSAQDRQQMIHIKNSIKYICSEPILIIIGEIAKNITSNIFIFNQEGVLVEQQFWES